MQSEAKEEEEEGGGGRNASHSVLWSPSLSFLLHKQLSEEYRFLTNKTVTRLFGGTPRRRLFVPHLWRVMMRVLVFK